MRQYYLVGPRKQTLSVIAPVLWKNFPQIYNYSVIGFSEGHESLALGIGARLLIWQLQHGYMVLVF